MSKNHLLSIDPIALGAILTLCLVIVGVLYVAFGEVTVRRLRKIQEVKDVLGLDLVGGMDIVNVAMALSMPRSFNRKASASRLAFLFADADVLYKHTTRFDRVLARVFQWSLVATVAGLAFDAILFGLSK